MSPAFKAALKSFGIILWGALLAALTGPMTQQIVESIFAVITAALHDRSIDFGPWQAYAIALWIAFAGQFHAWVFKSKTPQESEAEA